MAGRISDGCAFRNCKIYSRLEKNLLGLTSPRKLHTCDNEFWNTNDTTHCQNLLVGMMSFL